MSAGSSRTPIVGGNWKMNLDRATAYALAEAVARGVGSGPGVEVTVFPPLCRKPWPGRKSSRKLPVCLRMTRGDSGTCGSSGTVGESSE